MANRFMPTAMDCGSPGYVHKGLEITIWKCELIFDGLLDGTDEGQKVWLLLL